MKTIVPIVEGPGDVQAVSELLRRVLGECLDEWGVHVIPGMKLGRGQITDSTNLERHLRLAALTPGCFLIIIFVDRDDDNCRTLVEHVRLCAVRQNLAQKVEALVINREYETWLLAGIESLRGERGIVQNASAPENYYEMRNPKGMLTSFMEGSRAYSETADQVALTSLVDLVEVKRRCSCFSKLIEKVKRHVEAMV